MTETQKTFCIARYPDLCAACSAEEQARKKYEHIDDVIKRLMTDLGMSESKSLYLAFKQLQNEIAQLQSQAQQPPRMQFLDRSREKIITLLWQGICDGTVEAFDVNGMMVIPSEEGMTYVRKEDAISFFGLVEKSQAQQTERKWISVEERLPEDNSTVMAADQWGNIQITFYTENHDYFNHTYGYKLNRKDHGKYSKRFEWARKYPTRITHWMPLPPAPEGE